MIIKRRNKSQTQENTPKPSVEKKEKKPQPEALVINKPSARNFAPASIKERQERRRGDRRRGYRRIDDRNLISRAQEEADTIKESASREGFEHGITLYKEEIQKLNTAIIELISAKEKVMQSLIPDIAIIAVKAAEKLLKKELEVNENIILDVITEVVKSISKDETRIIIKTHKKDTELVKKSLPEIFPYTDQSTKIIVMPDEEVDRGSCIVETKSGVIDARFSTQLQILQQALAVGL